MAAGQALERLVRRLEADPGMRKGRLVDMVLNDPEVDWLALYDEVGMRGCHRHKRRWRQLFVTQRVLQRTFPRGGSRHRLISHQEGPAAPLRTAPWFVDVMELAPFRAADVWARFQLMFPVLAIYRVGWRGDDRLGERPPDSVHQEWETFWQGRQVAAVADIARVLRWRLDGEETLDLLVPVAAALWPDQPWSEAWLRSAPCVARGAVPYLRRAACLLDGFRTGRCSPRCVYEAMKMPLRNA